MSAITNVVVFDGASTPVGHTLVPLGVRQAGKKLVATWREMITSLPAEAQVSMVISMETLKSGVVKTDVDISFPVMESVSGQNASGYTAAPKVAYVDRNVWTSYQHPRSTVTSRRIARQALVNVANNVTTTQAALTGGPVPEVIDQQIMPT